MGLLDIPKRGTTIKTIPNISNKPEKVKNTLKKHLERP